MIETTRSVALGVKSKMGASAIGVDMPAEVLLDALGDTIPLMHLAILAEAALRGEHVNIDEDGRIGLSSSRVVLRVVG